MIARINRDAPYIVGTVRLWHIEADEWRAQTERRVDGEEMYHAGFRCVGVQVGGPVRLWTVKARDRKDAEAKVLGAVGP